MKKVADSKLYFYIDSLAVSKIRFYSVKDKVKYKETRLL